MVEAPSTEPTEQSAVPDSGDVDLLVIGGGVMGLFTAYHAARSGRTVAVLEAGRIGDPATASFGKTRSYRRDYLDPLYARLAERAIELWNEFEQQTGARALVRCGCMNIASSKVTPDLAHTYGRRTAAVMDDLGMSQQSFDRAELTERFPYLDADEAFLDPLGGLADLGAVAAALTEALRSAGASIVENSAPTGISSTAEGLEVEAGGRRWRPRSMVITAGHGTNDVLRLLPDNTLDVPITRDRPNEAFYYRPDPAVRDAYTAEAMPVIAYLDTGIYLHPIVDGVIDAVKIGYYNPPDLNTAPTPVTNVATFVDLVMPGLAGAQVEPVTVVDQCDYDLVGDDDFVLGPVPGRPGVYVGVGWRGTGYKFAPWIGATLADLAEGREPAQDISRFTPSRFVTS